MHLAHRLARGLQLGASFTCEAFCPQLVSAHGSGQGEAGAFQSSLSMVVMMMRVGGGGGVWGGFMVVRADEAPANSGR